MNEVAVSIHRAVKVLEAQFGVPKWRRKEPLDELIITILSQNTNDANRDLAYSRLRGRFSSVEDIAFASVGEIEDLIRPAGLSHQKSARIKDILEWIKESFGQLSLAPIGDMGDEEAIALLTQRKGIGIKTAAVLLAFAFGRDLCPVDTHVNRIALRLGWVKANMGAGKTFWFLKPMIPKGKAPTFHLNLLKFGRAICTARRPACNQCPLWSDCKFPDKGEYYNTKSGVKG